MNEDSPQALAHRAEAERKMSPLGKRLFKYVEFDDKETLLAEVRKHPVGFIAIGVVGVFVALAVLAASLILAANLESLGFNTGSGSTEMAIIISIGAILALFIAIATTISIILYMLNVIYVTDEKIAEVAYLSLFNRKVTQLNIGKVQDVTVHQKGILPHVFNYGSMLVETAGEIPNRAFTYLPNPNKYSHIIIEAHDAYVEKHGN